MFQHSSLAEKPLHQWEIATHWWAFQNQDKSRHSDPHLDQTKFNGLLPLTIDGVLVPYGSQRHPNFKAVTEWQNFATLWILYYIYPRHQKGSSSKKNGPLTVRLTVWFDAPLPLLWSDFCGVSLILYYDYKCSETELHKKGVISIQLLLSPIPIYLLFYANKITRTTKRILLILHAELSRQRFIWDIL